MTFAFRLETPETISPEQESSSVYDPELDDIRSVLRDLCASLAELPEVRFTLVLGEPLPLSIRRDLAIVMEQLGDVIYNLRTAGAAALDLYEQGLEVQLALTVEGEQTKIELRDLLERPMSGREDHAPRDAVARCLNLLARTFVDAARRRSPQRAAHPWFEEWARSLLALLPTDATS